MTFIVLLFDLKKLPDDLILFVLCILRDDDDVYCNFDSNFAFKTIFDYVHFVLTAVN